MDNKAEQSLLNTTKWYAVYTKSRHEKYIAKRLIERHIECFLPVKTIQRKWKDRKKNVDFPLFPGYLFAKIPLSEKNSILKIKGAICLVGNPNPVPVDQIQIEAVMRFIESDIAFDPYPELQKGTAITVKNGPLKGITGILVEKKTSYRLVVNLDIISSSVSTEIDVADIEPV